MINMSKRRGLVIRGWITAVCVVMVYLLVASLSGCMSIEQRERLKEYAHERIIHYLEEEGSEKACEYIDTLVAEDKLTKTQADRLKAAMPQGINKVKEVMGEAE